MNEQLNISGKLEVYRVRGDVKELVFSHKNTIDVGLRTAVTTAMISRAANLICADAIAWGSYDSSCGSYVDSCWAGTTSFGTQGGLAMSNPTTSSVKFSGTFSFGSTVQINMYRVGKGYATHAAGITELFTSLYAYDNSLYNNSSYLTFDNGETQVVDWTITLS